jgi:hypothetical protein
MNTLYFCRYGTVSKWRALAGAWLACLGVAFLQGALAQELPATEQPGEEQLVVEAPLESTPVVPATGTAAQLPAEAAESPTVAAEPASHLDRMHDRTYRWLQGVLSKSDAHFGEELDAPIVVPLSPLRVGLAAQMLHRPAGWRLAGTPDFDATLELPNLKERYRLFISSGNLPGSPRTAVSGRDPLLAGVRVEPKKNINFDLGIHLKLVPSVFTAVRWGPGYNLGRLQVFPYAKVYVETGLGAGASGGLTLERHWGRWIARSSSFTDWRRNAAAASWTQSFVAGYARAVIRQRRYDLLATGNDLACGAMLGLTVSGDRASQASAYEATLLIKRPLHGGWLYGYVEPLVRWERAGNWHPDAGLRVGIDVLFWGLATLPAQAASYCR